MTDRAGSPGEKIRLGISACLLGERVRYDGGQKLDPFLRDRLGRYVDWVAVCPEVEYGLPVPREAMRLIASGDGPRLVTVRSGIDHTVGMKRWAAQRLRELEKEDLCGFVFKSRSPSSGLRGVKMYDASGIPSARGSGIFAGAFSEHFRLLPVEEDDRLRNPALRENFIERIFVLRRWRDLVRAGGKVRDMVEFHTDHKLLILSHSVQHYRTLGSMVAAAKSYRSGQLHAEYGATLMEALGLLATARKHTNVLGHMMGYFKKLISSGEKAELADLIEQYRRGFLPLIVPVTLISHYVRKYEVAYLARQHYLKPHSLELLLRNHA